MTTPLTTTELAAKFGVAESTIRKWRQRGKLTPLYVLPSGDCLYARSTRKPKQGKAGRPKIQS